MNELDPNDKMTKWEIFRLYAGMVKDTVLSVFSVMTAGLGLCLAISLANMIAQTRFTSLARMVTPALIFLTLTCTGLCLLMWASIVRVFWKGEIYVAPSVIITAIAGATLMVGISNSFVMSYRARVEPRAPATFETANLVEGLPQHPELSGNDAKLIALAQAIKNIMDAGRPPCSPTASPTPSPEVNR